MTGMVNMLRRVQQEFPSRYVACIFDPKGKTFRDDIYAEYKANRSAMPEDLAVQIPVIFDLVRALGWPLIQVDGLEADDVIGTLAVAAQARGLDCLIATGDKDMAQLVNERVMLVDTMSRDGGPIRRTGIEGVVEKFGVRPDQIIDYLTLVGDAVDNVPGVEKVGPKTAAKWLAQYGSLDAIVAHADEIGGVVGQNLRKALDWLPTARTLVTIKLDADLGGLLEGFESQLTMGQVDTQRLAELRDLHGLSRTLKGLADAAATPVSAEVAAALPSLPAAPAETRYTTVSDEQGLQELQASLMAESLAAFDTETTSLEARHADIVGLSFCWTPGQAAYVPVGHRSLVGPEQLPLARVLEVLRPWFESEAHGKVAHHLKYDWAVMRRHGVSLKGRLDDTLLQSYVLEAHQPHDLARLALQHLGRSGLSYDDLTGKGASRIGFEEVPIEQASQYSCEDADFTLQLHHLFMPRLQADAGLLRVYDEIEMPCVEVLLQMEAVGIAIDAPLLDQQSADLSLQINELEVKAHALAGGAFNLGSPKQLGEILFERLGYPPVKKTAKGAPSTDEEVLEALAQDYPLPKVLLEWRGLSKLKSTYTDKLPKMTDPVDGRLHTHFSQSTAVTGRLASSDPNLQNIPIRTAEGRRIRKAFVAPPGTRLVSADYSQVELRIMAHLSEDPSLLRAFAEGVDVHRATAAEVFGLAPEAVGDEQRRAAKAVNFGLIYGMSAFGLSQNLGIERGEAARIMERYFDRYPGVARYMEQTKAQAKERGYVETVLGRRLWLPEIRSPNGPRRAGAERAAINAPMQGSAADIIKVAMVRLASALAAEGLRSRLLLQVHDELILEVPEDEMTVLLPLLTDIMENTTKLRVPLEVTIGSGPNWDEAH